jgi:hypothetical protein
MKHVTYIVAAAALAVALAGCGDPYPRYSTPQYSYAPSGYGYAPAGYNYAPAGYSYAPAGYANTPASSSSYDSRADYYRNYNGIHAAPELSNP